MSDVALPLVNLEDFVGQLVLFFVVVAAVIALGRRVRDALRRETFACRLDEIRASRTVR